MEILFLSVWVVVLIFTTFVFGKRYIYKLYSQIANTIALITLSGFWSFFFEYLKGSFSVQSTMCGPFIMISLILAYQWFITIKDYSLVNKIIGSTIIVSLFAVSILVTLLNFGII